MREEENQEQTAPAIPCPARGGSVAQSDVGPRPDPDGRRSLAVVREARLSASGVCVRGPKPAVWPRFHLHVQAPALGSHDQFLHQPAGRAEHGDPNGPRGGTAPVTSCRRGGGAELPQHPLEANMMHVEPRRRRRALGGRGLGPTLTWDVTEADVCARESLNKHKVSEKTKRRPELPTQQEPCPGRRSSRRRVRAHVSSPLLHRCPLQAEEVTTRQTGSRPAHEAFVGRGHLT